MVKCPNCGQKTIGDYCQYCNYSILKGTKEVTPPKDNAEVEVRKRNNIGLQSYTSGLTFWERIFGAVSLGWDIFIMDFPLWSRHTSVKIRSGVVEVLYSLGKSKTEEQFLLKVTRFAAKTMDKFLRHKGIIEVDVWAMSSFPLGERNRKSIWDFRKND